MYSNNLLNFQESTTILNTSTKKSGKLLKAPHIAYPVTKYVLRFKWARTGPTVVVLIRLEVYENCLLIISMKRDRAAVLQLTLLNTVRRYQIKKACSRFGLFFPSLFYD